jgi:hypothetical protein
MRDNLAPMSWERQVFAIPNEGHHNRALFVLKPTSLQLNPACSSQSLKIAASLAGVGLGESE